jgi:hypothetical protein
MSHAKYEHLVRLTNTPTHLKLASITVLDTVQSLNHVAMDSKAA